MAWGEFALNVEDSGSVMRRRVSRIYERTRSQKTPDISEISDVNVNSDRQDLSQDSTRENEGSFSRYDLNGGHRILKGYLDVLRSMKSRTHFKHADIFMVV